MPAVSRLAKYFFIFLVLALAAIAGFTLFTLNWSYSEGDRAGVVQKFSKKGWLCKTWEGELLLLTLPTVAPEKFEFSVRDDAVAKQIMANIGKRMVLSYSQHKGVPNSCFADTEYFIERVQSQDGSSLPATVLPAPAANSSPVPPPTMTPAPAAQK